MLHVIITDTNNYAGFEPLSKECEIKFIIVCSFLVLDKLQLKLE